MADLCSPALQAYSASGAEHEHWPFNAFLSGWLTLRRHCPYEADRRLARGGAAQLHRLINLYGVSVICGLTAGSFQIKQR